ncbi:phosphonoacetaldehyde reductase [Hungatella hathewayi]|uniref:phosphonoacetaldehyde reductase n=1 Tax=Hungatella hathewayi TaxID=154046 RepID=UPI00033BCBD5|nr:phosphonoacetaldehyde reductase [Hungatella hathewayi]CCZ60349.1 alcohol dehydrogenase class IV [Hungatella hathewayi CAG:224]
MKQQTIIEGALAYENIGSILSKKHIQKFLLVGGFSKEAVPLKEYWDSLNIPYVYFNGFSSNPLYQSLVDGVRIFRQEKCDMIIAVGGGSAIDVAKCIKLYSHMNEQTNFFDQEIVENTIPLMAVPTTAGTGSESTRFAVIYYNGEKQSICNESIIPDYVILEPELLSSLPLYQKKSTVMDALCQAIESMWSVNSTEESMGYSKRAITMILNSLDAYLDGEPESNEKILKASNLAGRAINITQTTAAHAMSYKITSLFGLPHGHAVALCLPHVWKYMNDHLDRCIDPRGAEYLADILHEIALCMKESTAEKAVEYFEGIMDKMGLGTDIRIDNAQLTLLASSVNPVRLKNNPVRLDSEVLSEMYSEIFDRL